MENFWRRLGIALGKYWIAVLIGFGLITAALSVGLSNLEFATGQDSYLNSDSQIAIDNEAFQSDFGGETLILLFEATGDAAVDDIISGANLAEFERIEAALRDVPEVYSVVTPLTSLTFSESIIKEGVGTAALLGAIEREPDEDAKALRQADASATLSRLGAISDQSLSNDEWVEFLLRDNTGDVRLSLQSTFPNDQTAVGGVLLTGNADLDTLSNGTQAVLDIVGTAELDGFDVTVTGSPVFLKDINDYLQGGMLTLGAIALVVMAVVLALLFRVRWRFLPLVSTVIGVAWGFAVLGFIDVKLSLVTISGLPILIGLGIDFAIQIHNRIEEEVTLDNEQHPIAETLSNIAPALIVATIGAVVAFLALQVSQVPMIRDFGVMLAIGIVALVICGIVLPASWLGIREWKSRTTDRQESRVDRVVVALGGLPQRAVIPMMIASIMLFGAGVALEGNVKIESDPIRWIDQDSQTVADLDRLSERTGFSSTLGVLVESNNVLAPEVAEMLHSFMLDAESTPQVVSTSSLVSTMAKVITVPGASELPPTSDDIAAAAAVLPPDIERVLISEDRTATQFNLRLAPASLDERAVLVRSLEDDLDTRIAELDLDPDSVLLSELSSEDPPVRAVPAGLAVVGVGLLENLSANRAVLTYFGLALAALWLLLRFRSLSRALLTLVPVGLAIGTSSVIVALSGISLSPLTTVSGPLVIASCTEFAVLIMARYLEERQRGLEPQAASDQAAGRTGRAFFTSAATTIGGFAVLIGSALPLLRDFGIIVTLNVAIALLAALVVMPPVLVWADGRNLLPIGVVDAKHAVVLAARPSGPRLAAWIGSVVVVLAIAVGLFASADRDSGESVEIAYVATALPTTTTTTTEPPPEPDVIDPADYPAERPAGLIDGTLYDLLVAQGADERAANCTGTILLQRVSQDELIALGIADFAPAALEPVVAAALDCQIPQSVIDATVAAGLG